MASLPVDTMRATRVSRGGVPTETTTTEEAHAWLR
jgi:hypothetical protein